MQSFLVSTDNTRLIIKNTLANELNRYNWFSSVLKAYIFFAGITVFKIIILETLIGTITIKLNFANRAIMNMLWWSFNPYQGHITEIQ